MFLQISEIIWMFILWKYLMIDKGNFIDNFNDECVSFIMGIGNDINVYIVEVPNETAPSIQGFAKPPA